MDQPLFEQPTDRYMLFTGLPKRHNALKLAVVDLDRRQSQGRTHAPWQVALLVDFITNLESYCEQLLETIGKDRLAAVAWLARNQLELLVWIQHCSASVENALRFHEDALRDLKGLVKAHGSACAAIGIEDEIADAALRLIQVQAMNELGQDDVDDKYQRVAKAAQGTESKDLFDPVYKSLSKFAHPTAILVNGFSPKIEACRALQEAFTTQGVAFAVRSTEVLETYLGLHQA